MAQSVKLADEIMDVVRRESGLQSRSVAGQLTHWVNIGRAIEKSKTFDYQHIRTALEGALSPDDLSPEEQEVWFEQFAGQMTEPGKEEEVFYKNRQKLGQGVGLSDSGELIWQTS